MPLEEAGRAKLALIVEYDGSRYAGSQVQSGKPTVQGELESALRKVTGEPIRIKAASRTDSGAHARGQVVSFETGSKLAPETFVKALNYYLPEDISVRAAARVDMSFDARRSAISREYEYTILNSVTRSPLRRRYAYQVARPLDVAEMGRACEALVGEQDFAAFTGASEKSLRGTVRVVRRAGVRREGESVVFGIVANAFLPQQIRRMVGALIRVGSREMTVEDFMAAVRSGERGALGPTAPALGLCLVRVDYGPEMSWFRGNTNEDI
ncbi:MAG: tRNA pseudouridine(38-40) synthase TruA [Chloroflexi bacterium]|nr:tRNA pseudouridine(38-40) synthase TruA [Chloroflexota bacterium]